MAAQPDFFEIRLSDVPERVCQNIVDSDWVLPSGWEINGSSEDGVMCAATNSMAFFFYRVLDNTKVANGEETTEEAGEPCSGHGTWCGCGCSCDTGWYGDDCSLDEMPQICDVNGNCRDCSDTSEFIEASDASECSKCDGTGYTWVAGGPIPRCIPCSMGEAISDFEDSIADTCRKCGLGVNWSHCGNWNNWWGSGFCGCASGSDDVAPETTTVPETTYTDYETTYTDYETTYTDYETTVSGESDCSGHGT